MEDDLITTKEVGDYRIKVYYCHDSECPITNWGLFGSFFFEYSDTHRLHDDLFMEKYGKVMGEHYYNKFVHEFNGNILKMIGYFRGSEKEGQVFCDMITECIEKYEQRGLYSRGKLNN